MPLGGRGANWANTEANSMTPINTRHRGTIFQKQTRTMHIVEVRMHI